MVECSAIRLQGEAPATIELNDLEISREESAAVFLASLLHWKWENQ